jgi:GNAT superfamily N-acetyltransferase
VKETVEIREESPNGRSTQALFAEYLALLRDRLGIRFEPSERIFATDDQLDGTDGAWLVLYANDVAVGCGGLRRLESGVAEVKRMFVSQSARRSGYGRRLLHALEDIAIDRGNTRVCLVTTEVLSEARRLYIEEGYRVIQRIARGRHPVEIWMEKDVP